MGLLPQKQRLRSQQRRAFGKLHIGGRIGYLGLGGSRARSAWACSHESSAYGRSSGARLGSYTSAAAPAAKALVAPERARRGLFSRKQCLRTQQRRAFGNLHVGGGTGLHEN